MFFACPEHMAGLSFQPFAVGGECCLSKKYSTSAQMQDEEHKCPLKAFGRPDFFRQEVGTE
jgi:hypothetical protein